MNVKFNVYNSPKKIVIISHLYFNWDKMKRLNKSSNTDEVL